MLLRPTNLLLLDEPTNHLDIATREQLESTLATFTGTMVFATHDRYLADRLATKVAVVEQQRVRVYEGGYKSYRRAVEAEAAASKSAVSAPTPIKPSGVASVESPAQQRRSGSEQRRLAAELRAVEQRVTEAEARLRGIEDQLSNPHGLSVDLRDLTREHAGVAAEVAALTERWEELMLQVEGAA
jgi:ATP-binding cassette subfamily F protein 3